ncbi:HET-domain-containing protein [Rostrohypoxylon terebratum]|nr:HET-domain-containing protein [Rostrohypoxylon terebratum]
MRLIDVTTLELKQFHGDQTPQYAILSHTWDGDNEVTFQEWERRADSAIQRKSGYAKIMGACRRARADGLQYLWCDTNCIDKTSSAELSEAINSMFAWYRDSTVCYAYLADVQATAHSFEKSQLLAPCTVIFFDGSWVRLGDKISSADKISGITKIHKGALMDRSTIHDYSLAQRMSWAANRQTTRSEDIAYCLLGIFDINMPLLYGEGLKAFTRLQREIIKPDKPLAPSPIAFRFCGSIARAQEIKQEPYSVTNLGISINLPVVKTLMMGTILVGLNCAMEIQKNDTSNSECLESTHVRRQFRIWILLRHLEHDRYIRVHKPSSRIFLDQSYSFSAHPTSSILFLALLESPAIPTASTEPGPLISKTSFPPNASGSLITVSSGKLAPLGSVLRETYPLGKFTIISLKPRGPSTLSHQLISSGSFVTIISIFWNRYEQPQDWLQTTVVDTNMLLTRQMAVQTEWGCIFNGRCQHLECCNSISSLQKLHKRLRYAYGRSSIINTSADNYPLIAIENSSLKDIFGQPIAILRIMFRENPRPG